MESELKEIKKHRELLRARRKKDNIITAALVGYTNAGKSSLLNYLTGYDRAIVTDIPGTTRDTIEEFTEIDGYPVIFTDTAGLRESNDIVEQIGVDKARQEIHSADLVLYVVDPNEEPYEQADFTGGYVIINKTDSATAEQIEKCRRFYSDKPILEVSVLEQKGTTAIFDAIKETFDLGDNSQGEMLITNARHKQLIDQAAEALRRGLNQYKAGMPLDCITYDMWQSAGYLGEIVGESVSEEIIDSIFDRFCLGK